MSDQDPTKPVPPADQWYHDANGAQVLTWEDMDVVARYSAVLAALTARHPLEPGNLRHDPKRKIVFSMIPDVRDRARAAVHIAPVVPEDVAVARLRSGWSERWTEVERFVRRRRRWVG